MGKTTGQASAAFAAEVLKSVFDGFSLDGFDLQELAVKHGLLVKTKYDPKKHSNAYDDYVEPGDPWYVFSRGLKLSVSRAASRKES